MTSAIDQSTMPLLPSKDTLVRMRHFSDTVYNKDESSTLYKYVDAIVGDAGVGTLKKELLIARLSQSLDTTYFTDLDNAFGHLVGLVRQTSEQYGINPSTGQAINPSSDLLTTDQWDQIRVQDSWYRARIKDFFTALGLGGTPDGLRLMVRAAIGVDAEIYEMWRFQDFYGQIYGVADLDTITNLVPNPNIEIDSSNWSGTFAAGGSLIRDNSFSSAEAGDGGTWGLKLSSGTNGLYKPAISCAKIPIIAGKIYNLSFSYYVPSANTIAINCFLYYYDSSGNFLSQLNTGMAQTTNARTRFNYTFTAPNGAASMYFDVHFVLVPTSVAQFLYLDSAMLISASAVQPYFDGNTSGYRWTGQVGNSPSILASPIDAASRLKVPSRNEIIVYPHKANLTTYELLQVRKMLKRLSPVDSVITVPAQAFGINVPISIDSVASDSTYFQVNSYVTGFTGSQLSPTQESNSSYRWVKDGYEVKAPTLAFGESQEYSEYYVYSNDTRSAIDSVTYSSETANGSKNSEQNYKTITKTVSAWGAWTFFDTADSPDNFPGGQNGKTPTKAPALTLQNKPYVFPYTSQQAYVAKMKLQVSAAGGQVRTLSQETPLDRSVFQAPISAGETTDTQYRLPLSAIEQVLNSWTPQEAIANQVPAKLSTVTSGWYAKNPGAS